MRAMRAALSGVLVGLAPWAEGRADRVEPVTGGDHTARAVAAGESEAAQLLRRLDRISRIAGNAGDVYDNRDRGHSLPPLERFPQLSRVVYDQADRDAGRDFGLATRVRPGVVVGNSSTSAPPDRGGSNPRRLYAHPSGLALGWRQYVGNNLYVYPEHRDFEPGPFGLAGGGDRYHAHTPYLLITRGSSGSDRPYLEAVFASLAAMRPEVKRRLTEAGLLMPTVQMLLRRSLPGVHSDDDYLASAAHPAVFPDRGVNLPRLVRASHRLSADRLPPLAVMQIVRESESRLGRDYFLSNQPERWSMSPAAISRVLRGPRAAYEIVLDLGRSFDVNDRPLTFQWRLLQGDPAEVEIKPLDETGQRVALRVGFHNDAFPASGDPAVESRRVDVAAFAHNGETYSAPSIVSFYMPPHQRMTVDSAGRVVESGYGAFALALAPPASLEAVRAGEGYVADWPALASWMLGPDEPAGPLRRGLPDRERRRLDAVADTLGNELARWREQRRELARSERALEAADTETDRRNRKINRDTAELRTRELAHRLCRLLFALRLDGGGTGCDALLDALRSYRDTPTLYTRFRHGSPAISVDTRRVLGQLDDLGILVEEGEGRRVRAIRSGEEPLADRLTAFERNQLAALHEQFLADLSGGVVGRPEPMRGDPRVTLPHVWRDVFSWSEAGELTGWTRYVDGERLAFGPDGRRAVAEGGWREVHYRARGPDAWSRTLSMVRRGDADPAATPSTRD